MLICLGRPVAQGIAAPQRGIDYPLRKVPVRVLLRRFVEEEISYLGALQSDPVSHILADP
jgi:hypothetical protein